MDQFNVIKFGNVINSAAVKAIHLNHIRKDTFSKDSNKLIIFMPSSNNSKHKPDLIYSVAHQFIQNLPKLRLSYFDDVNYYL